MRERVRILPTPTTYSSSAPATNQPLDIGLLLGFREVAIASKRKFHVCCPVLLMYAFSCQINKSVLIDIWNYVQFKKLCTSD